MSRGEKGERGDEAGLKAARRWVGVARAASREQFCYTLYLQVFKLLDSHLVTTSSMAILILDLVAPKSVYLSERIVIASAAQSTVRAK